MKKLTLWLIIILFSSNIFSQKEKIELGKIDINKLKSTDYEKDSGVDAYIILDYGHAGIISQDYDLKIRLQIHRKIKILKPSGLEWADVEIKGDNVTNIKAASYELKNGEFVSHPLNRKDIYIEENKKGSNVHKFAIPNAKVGSIIEYTYEKIIPSYFYFTSWYFQDIIPVEHSEFVADIPRFLNYSSRKSSFYEIKSTSQSNKFDIGDGFRADGFTTKWIAEDLPAFVEEGYMPSIYDYLTKIEFELKSINLPNYSKSMFPKYEDLNKKLLEDEDFGLIIKNSNSLNKILNIIIDKKDSQLKRLQKIYNYVNTNIKWNGKNSIYASSSLNQTISKKRGNSADINLLLTAMLKLAGITAEPTILSTRNNGKIYEHIVDVSKFNYTICWAKIFGKSYLLDATNSFRPINELPYKCMNGKGWRVSSNIRNMGWVDLLTKEQFSQKTTVKIRLNEMGDVLGKITEVKESYDASNVREEIATYGEKYFFDEIKSNFGSWNLDSFKVENAEKIDTPLILNYQFVSPNYAQKEGDLLFFNPILINKQHTTQFKNVDRKFPIDFGVPIVKYFITEIEIPENYSIEEIPESQIVRLPQNNGRFIYNVNSSGNKIFISSIFQINKPEIPAKDYPQIKQFFEYTINKQNSIIILRKSSL